MDKPKSSHQAWHDYQQMFYVEPHAYSDSLDNLRFRGPDLVEQAKSFTIDHPSVCLVRCDDDCHSSSYLMIIPHEGSEGFAGLHLISLPQRSNAGPKEMWLYPSHLLDTLQALGRLVGLMSFNEFQEPLSPSKEAHSVYRHFQEGFYLDPGDPSAGWDLDWPQAAVDFMADYPDEGVECVRCDDALHMNSELLFIPHSDQNGLHGVTLVSFPQQGRPLEMFLEPKSMLDLQAHLTRAFLLGGGPEPW